MRNVEQLALVIQLACLTEDRDKAEQKALAAVARRVDRERNAITTKNPRARHVSPCPGDWNTFAAPPELPRFDRNSPEVRALIGADNPDCHPSGCICQRNNVIPADGPSMLEALVETTWSRQ